MASSNTQFKKGCVPWNKGLKGTATKKSIDVLRSHVKKHGAWNKGKKGVMLGSVNGMWKGDKVGYIPLHQWVRRHKGKPEKCSKCGSKRFIDWANISGEYKRDLGDYMALCRKCHNLHDDIYRKIWESRRKNLQLSVA